MNRENTPYCKYMLIYDDNALHITVGLSQDMAEIKNVYRLEGHVGSPGRYVGANVEQVQLRDGCIA